MWIECGQKNGGLSGIAGFSEQLVMSQRIQWVGETRSGKESNLYGSRSVGMMKVGGRWQDNLLLEYLKVICSHVSVHTSVMVWRLKDNLWELVLSFYVGPGNRKLML